MTDQALLDHLLASHPGARVPWFAGSAWLRGESDQLGWISVMSDDALERLHLELCRQGEDCSVALDAPQVDWRGRLRRADAVGVA